MPMEVRMQTRLARSWTALRYDLSSQRALDNAAPLTVEHERLLAEIDALARVDAIDRGRARARSRARRRRRSAARPELATRVTPTVTLAPSGAFTRAVRWTRLLYWVVKGVLTPILRVCVRVQGRGPRARPRARAR